MKKETKTAEKTQAAAATVELEALHIQLAEERFKNEALSRQVVRLGQALDAAVRADDERIEGDMICIVNANNAKRSANERKAAEIDAKNKAICKSFMRHARVNAATIGLSVTAATFSIVAGHYGVISPVVSTALSFVTLPIVGWAIHECALLFKFTGIVKG